MPILKFSTDQVSAYQFRSGALREGRSLAEFVRRCAERGLIAAQAVAIPDAEIVREERNMDGKTTVAAYLSGPLARVIREVAAQTGRSQSHVMRDMLRNEARRRGLLPSSQTEPTSADIAAE